MKKLLLIALIIPLFAIAADSDMDGVSNSKDKCPHTPFWAVVNKNGCMSKKIIAKR